jgi:hypothetical protein
MARKKRPGESSPRRGRRQIGSESNEPSSDYLLDAANEHWPYILTAYKQFADKRPVMLFDIQEKRIYAYLTPTSAAS